MNRLVVTSLLIALAVVAGGASEFPKSADDELDAHIGDAMRDALRGRPERAARLAIRLNGADEYRKKVGRPLLNLSDELLALAAGVAGDSSERRAYREELLESDADAYIAEKAIDALRGEPLIEFKRLGRQDRWNRVVRPVNAIIANGARFFEGQPQALIQLPIDIIYTSAMSFDLTERQVKQMTLSEQIERDKELWRKAPDSVFEKAERTRQRLQDRQVKYDLALAERLLKAERFREVIAECRRVLEDEPDHRKARHLLDDAEAGAARRYRWAATAMGVSADEPWPDSPETSAGYERLLHSTVLLNADADGTNIDFATMPIDLMPAADYAATAQMDAASDKVGAMSRLRHLAQGDDAFARRATAWVDCATYNDDIAIEQARRERSADRRYYIFWGLRRHRDNVYVASKALVRQSGAALANLGIFNALEALARAVRVYRKPIASPETLMDALAQSIERDPDAPEAMERRRELARLKRFVSLYDLAADEFERAGALTPKLSKTLERREGGRRLDLIERVPDAADRVAAYDRWLTRWGDHKKADDAREARQEAAEEARVDFRLSRDMIEDDAARWLALGAPIDEQWLDGAGRNGEIDDDGVAFIDDDGKWIARFQLRRENDAREVAVSPVVYARLRSAWGESDHRVRSIESSRAIRDTRVLPIDIQAGAGASGASFYPQLQLAPDTPDLKLYRE